MTAQHMVEHLILTVKLSYGRIKIPEFTPDERQLAMKQKLLFELDEFPKGIKAPGLGDKLLPLRYQNLTEAKEELITSLRAYAAYYHDNEGATHIHPRFGGLNKSEWDLFHQKHFGHHLGQFGLSE
ncbi:DUF1569 domain-containing protein [Algoriphagus namhaensis]